MQGTKAERMDSTARFVSVILPAFPIDPQWWFPPTALVHLSMLVLLMYERFQSSGEGHLHAFVDGEVWRRYEKRIIEFD
jgi:hypothetical protein